MYACEGVFRADEGLVLSVIMSVHSFGLPREPLDCGMVVSNG